MGGVSRKKLPSGATPTGCKDLTSLPDVFKVKEICHIIRVCSEAGVTELKFGGLEVKFGGAFSPADKPKPATLGFQENKAYQSLPQKPVLPESDTFSQQMSFTDRSVLEELERSQLMLEDPLAYEQMVIDSYVGDVGTDADGREGIEAQ